MVSLLLLPIGRANADWDDDIVNFVDVDVPVLTKKYAENDLRKRWMDAFLAPIAQVGALQADIVRRVQALVFPQIGGSLDVPAAISVLKSIDLSLASLHFDQSRLEKAEAQIDSLASACQKPAVYGGIAIQTVGTLAISNVTLPDRPPFMILYFGDPYFISAIVTAIYSIFMWDQDKTKRERARDAFTRLPTRIVSADWTVERSKEICNEIREMRLSGLETYKNNIHSFAEHLHGYEARLWEIYHRLELVLGKASFKDVLTRSGIWSVEITRSHNLASGRLLIDLELAVNEIRQLELKAKRANGCSVGISNVEAYEDSLVELNAETSVFIRQPQLPRTKARLEDTRKAINKKISTLATLYQLARDRGCPE